MIRLLILIFFLLLSLLAVFPAPAYPLWLVSIFVTELPGIFAAIVICIFFWGIRGPHPRPYPRLCAITAGLALLFYLSPIVRAYGVARQTGAPFHWWKLFIPADRPTQSQTFVYSDKDSLTLDFYPSGIKGRQPCIIVIHGGSWSSGDSRQLPELNSRLAKEGYAVAAINYRLAPRCQYPCPVEDVQKALHYLQRRAGELSIDPGSFVLLGRSAGAQIALLAAYTLPDPAIKGVISFYGPADMVWGYSLPANPLIMDSRKVMADYLGGSYEAVPRQYVSSSPIEFVTRHSVPTLLIHGREDPLVAYEHSTRLDKKLTDSGVSHLLLTLPWATHGFDYFLNGPGGQLSTWSIERFLHTIKSSAREL
jgi:acetyl esterase/lipase